MTAAILTILAALVPFLVWLWRRKVETDVDPTQQNRERYQQIDNDIGSKNSNQATAHGSDDLDELERLQKLHGDKP